MSHELESGFFTNLPAWHGLGTVLDAPPTISEALKLAGLDWTVSLQQLGRMTSKGFKKANRWAMVRSTDDAELGTCGKVWRPLQNEKAFEWFQPIVDSGLATLEAAGSLRGGARVWILTKIAGKADVIVPEADDKVERYILLAHGHDGVLAIRTGITPVRVVCQNTLSAAIAGNNLVKIFHHAKAGATLDAARDIIIRANGAFDKAADAYRALAEVKNISARQLRAYVDAVFPKQKTAAEIQAETDGRLARLLDRAPARMSLAQELEEAEKESKSFIFEEVSRLLEEGAGSQLLGVKGTAWGAYNAMTEFLTHTRGKDADSRLNNSFFGAEGAHAITGALETFIGSGSALSAAA